MASQLEMFPGYEQPQRGYGIATHEDGEHFDVLCGCGVRVDNLAYQMFRVYRRDSDGAKYIRYVCCNCGNEIGICDPSSLPAARTAGRR